MENWKILRPKCPSTCVATYSTWRTTNDNDSSYWRATLGWLDICLALVVTSERKFFCALKRIGFYFKSRCLTLWIEVNSAVFSDGHILRRRNVPLPLSVLRKPQWVFVCMHVVIAWVGRWINSNPSRSAPLDGRALFAFQKFTNLQALEDICASG